MLEHSVVGKSGCINAWCGALLVLCACTTTTEPPPQVNQGQRPLAQPPPNVVGGFSIQLPEEVLEPGDEVFPCWIFPLEVSGPSRIVGGGKLVTSADIDKARRLGATDVEIHDTVLIAAVFCLCNRYVDGLATWAPDDPAFYRQRAALVAENGYAASTLTGPTK